MWLCCSVTENVQYTSGMVLVSISGMVYYSAQVEEDIQEKGWKLAPCWTETYEIGENMIRFRSV